MELQTLKDWTISKFDCKLQLLCFINLEINQLSMKKNILNTFQSNQKQKLIFQYEFRYPDGDERDLDKFQNIFNQYAWGC